MWSRFTNAIRSHSTINKDDSSTSSEQNDRESDVITKVREEHPNLSHFYHPNEAGGSSQPTADASNSPSVHSKKSMLKRLSRPTLKEDSETQRAPSPFQLPTPLPKKSKGKQNLNDESSLPPLPPLPTDLPRRSSADMLRRSPDISGPSYDTTRSAKETRRRGSLDMLRGDSPPRLQGSSSMRLPESPAREDEFQAPTNGANYQSVRSILRDPKTPGTGQSVRFFSKDAYKVITPDQSSSSDLLNKAQPPLPPSEPMTFMDRLNQATSPDTPSSITKSHSRARPSINEIFSPLQEQPSLSKPSRLGDSTTSDMSLSQPVFSSPPGDHQKDSNIFEVSEHLDLPDFPPGLGFDVDAPFDSPDLNFSMTSEPPSAQQGDHDALSNRMTSTPLRDSKGKSKDKSGESPEGQSSPPSSDPIEVPAPTIVDEAVFHSSEKPPRFPSVLHDRSQSLTLGKTLFFSLDESNTQQSSAAYPSSDDVRPSLVMEDDSPSPKPTPNSFSRARTRAHSDTVFQSMLRTNAQAKANVPEADINDESCEGLVVYSGGASEPDPFSANANTYYTPQTMIPTTPPKGAPRHNRKTSKEESLIISLQTQLALRTELCAQYETDLKARDELVEILGKRLSDMEKEENKRKSALRAWKKKVQELERACRFLEEEVEGSRQESFERSVMDSASSEALRMLHRQIANLESEKNDWAKREGQLREEVETLEKLVKERSDDIMELKESLWTRDESDRELHAGLREAREQMDMLGNVSVAIDEDELKRLMLERDQQSSEEKDRHRATEFRLQQEIEELQTKYENLVVEKNGAHEKMVDALEQLKAREEEYQVLKNEVEAQWDHTEKASEKIGVMEKEKDELARERDMLKAEVEELERRTMHMEVDWNESENKKNELEAELQEVWNMKDALEKEREQLEDELQHEHQQVEQLQGEVQAHEDHIAELESERQFSLENVARLEENLRQRDQEVARYTQLSVDREEEAERLREEMSRLKREYSHLLDEQTRQLRDVTGQEGQVKARMDELVRAKAQVDIELKTSKDRLGSLTEEVERLRRQVHTLQLESADKEVKIVSLSKQRSQDKEDIQSLNIALDSKQQELELIKRKLGVRGTAGSTPAPSKVGHHRRDSSIFNATPISTASRPPSAMSDASTDITPSVKKKTSSETPQSSSGNKALALGKSARINATVAALNAASASSSSSKPLSRAGSEGTMGPPSMKSRPSLGTPTPLAKGSSLARSSASKLGSSGNTSTTPVAHRRVSSANSSEQTPRSKFGSLTSPTASVTEDSEKENFEAESASTRRRSLIPTLASPL